MTQPEEPRPPNPEALDSAWRIHAAVMEWTGRAEAKASFALTIESALIAGVITLSDKHRLLAHLNTRPELWWYYAGNVLLGAAVLCAVYVVSPRLRSGGLKAESEKNFVYFGHLRHLEPSEIQDKLETAELLPVLSRQLHHMSTLTWTKHLFVRYSMYMATGGAFCITIAAWLNS